MKRLTLGVSLLAALATFAPATARAFPCGWSTFIDNESSGENNYGPQFACRQDLISFFWNAYDFDQGDWDDGFGYESPCDYAQPLARMFHALFALHYSDANPPPNTGDFGGTILRWGGNYAAREIDEVDGDCDGGSALASTIDAGLDKYTEFYPMFFYDSTVPERASTVLHESRHSGGKPHGDPTCPDQASCDPSWGYDGANTWQIKWLWEYAVNGTKTTSALQERARDNANVRIDGRFSVHPGFHIYDAADRGDVYVASSSGFNFYGAGGKQHDWFCIGNEDCQVGDVNGDGKDDLVAFSKGDSGDVWVSLGTGSGFNGSGWKWHEAFCFGSQICKLGDANGDGKKDLVVFDGGTSGKVWVALSSGNGFNAGQGMWHGGWCVNGQQCEVADVNGDKKADLIAFDNGPVGKVWVTLSRGYDFFGASGLWHSGWCVNGQICRVSDASGDGKADIIAFDRGNSGKVWVALSSGAGFNGGQGLWHSGFCFGNQQCELGDVNGDKKTDLVVFDRGASGDVWVAFSRGNDFLGGQSQWHENFCTWANLCAVGDVTGDGWADILAFVRQ